MNRDEEKQKRLKSANEFIQVISSCGRQFFKHKGFVSTLELSEHGRVFFIDYYTKKRIYTHTRFCDWRGFTSGGSLKSLVENLRDFIAKNELMNASYFNRGKTFGNPWGYGKDIQIVKEAALRLGIAV